MLYPACWLLKKALGHALSLYEFVVIWRFNSHSNPWRTAATSSVNNGVRIASFSSCLIILRSCALNVSIGEHVQTITTVNSPPALRTENPTEGGQQRLWPAHHWASFKLMDYYYSISWISVHVNACLEGMDSYQNKITRPNISGHPTSSLAEGSDMPYWYCNTLERQRSVCLPNGMSRGSCPVRRTKVC